MSYTLDTNIVIYAFDRGESVKKPIAARLLNHSLTMHGMMPRQVLGELLAVAHRKPHVSLTSARATIDLIETAMVVNDTDRAATLAASQMAERYRLQYFDALICTIAQQNGASILFSEDMHDGLRLGSLTIVNPFAAANASVVRQALS